MLRISFLALLAAVYSAVIGIDFGSEYIKVALVRPGNPLHIVVDEMTKRKIEDVVGFADDERLFGNHASGLSMRKPERAFHYIQRLLGKTLESPEVKEFKKLGYAYNIVELENRTSAVGISYNKQVFAPEELVAMMFQYLKRISEADAEGPVKDCVIAVPEYWSQVERQAVSDAAEVAGLNVLGLVNENTAAAINYGIDRKASVEDGKHTILIYNMGSSSTQASVVTYSAYQTVEKKQNKTIGQFEVLGAASDSALGGRHFDHKVVELIMAEMKKHKNLKDLDPYSVPRVMAKLRAAANKAKIVLSANQDTQIAIPSLHNDVDLKMTITREQLVSASADLLDRCTIPATNLLSKLNIKPDELDAVVVVGGSTRIPAVQQALRAALKREELSFNLNGDEAMALGAVFRAANLSNAFRVRQVGLVESYPHNLAVQFASSAKDFAPVAVAPATTEESEEGSGSASSSGLARRVLLFPKGSRLPKKKTVTFPHQDATDFAVFLYYDNPPAHLKPLVLGLNVSGVEAVVADPANEPLLTFQGAPQKPRVSMSFVVDQSGLVTITKAEALLEEMIKVPVTRKVNKTVVVNDTESANETATNSTEEADEKKEGDAEHKEEEKEKEEKTEDKEEAEEKHEGEKKEEENKDEKKEGEEKAEESSEDSTATTANKTKQIVEEIVEYVDKKRTRRFPLKLGRLPNPGVVSPLSPSELKASRKLLQRLQDADDEKKRIAEAKNNLESAIFNTRSLMDDDSVVAVSTEEQREAVISALSQAEEWLGEQADDEAAKFVSKLDEIRKLSGPIQLRAREVIDRPKALNASATLFESIEGLLAEIEANRSWIPKEDREKLQGMVKNVTEWLTNMTTAQNELSATEPPAFFSSAVYDKLRPIAKFGEELTRRRKPVEKEKEKEKPKSKPKESKDKKKPKASSEADSSSDAKADDAKDTKDGEHDHSHSDL